ncbi:MAG: NAD-dependent epimerase/dehydratase family protein [Ferruginibacter sp.]
MKTFITGATGYIGNQLVKKLLEKDMHLHLLVRNPFSLAIPKHKNISIYKGDILNVTELTRAMQGCSHVYHCAAIARMSSHDRNKFFEVNVSGTQNVLDAAINTGVKKLVFTSSAAVFGPSLNIPLTEEDPRIEAFESDYDFAKHLAENLVREYVAHGLHTVIVNPSRVYGPGLQTYSNAVNRLIMQLMKKSFMLVPDVSQYRGNYTFLDDVVHGHIKAMEHGRAGENYILGGENISNDVLALTIKHFAARSAKIIKCPSAILKILIGISSPFTKDTDFNAAMIKRLHKHRMLCSDKAIAQLGYNITPFETGIETTIKYLKNIHS